MNKEDFKMNKWLEEKITRINFANVNYHATTQYEKTRMLNHGEEVAKKVTESLLSEVLPVLEKIEYDRQRGNYLSASNKLAGELLKKLKDVTDLERGE